MKIDLTVPEFSDEFQHNAVEFITDLEQYLEIKNIPLDCLLLIIGTTLKDRAKAGYFESNHNWLNLDDFVFDFNNEFDSIEYKAKKTNNWKNRTFGGRDGSFVQYYYQQVREANCIEPPISDYVRNYATVRQLKKGIQDTLAPIKLDNTSQVVKTLAWLDGIGGEANAKTQR